MFPLFHMQIGTRTSSVAGLLALLDLPHYSSISWCNFQVMPQLYIHKSLHQS